MQAYHRVEPCGYDVENFRAGIIASTIAKVNGNDMSAADFYPKYGQPAIEEDQSQREQMTLLMAVNGNHTED